MKTLLLMFLAIAISGLAVAHHGYAQFDTRAVITLKGTVTDFHYVNPHSVVEFDVKDDQGQVESWKGELTSPSHLGPRGWSATTLEPGQKIKRPRAQNRWRKLIRTLTAGISGCLSAGPVPQGSSLAPYSPSCCVLALLQSDRVSRSPSIPCGASPASRTRQVTR